MAEDYVINDLENVDPSPIAPRICACGCGNKFQPRRENQIYINKRHADKGYHTNVRKPKQANQKVIEKYMQANDRICEKYFKAQKTIESINILEALIADGFKSSYLLNYTFIKEEKYCITYNYLIHFFEEDGIQKAKIRKQ